MPVRSIKLTRAAQQTTNVESRNFFRFTVTASNGSNIDNQIFRFLRRPKDPLDSSGVQEDVFYGICTPEELAALPINNPDPDNFPAWLRKSSVDLVFQSEALGEAAWSAIQSDVDILLKALKKMDTLSVSQVITITV